MNFTTDHHRAAAAAPAGPGLVEPVPDRPAATAGGGTGVSTRDGGRAAIRVLVVVPQGLVRGALTSMLGTQPDLAVVEDASAAPHVVIVDVDAGEDAGLAGVERVAAAVPGAAVLILAGRATPAVIRRALDLGVRGVAGPDSTPDVLIDAVRRVAAGDWVVDPAAVLAVLQSAANPLTVREREVLRLAADGSPAPDIAKRLFLTAGTVRNHLSSAIRKVGGGNRLAAVRRAREAGWI